MVQFFSFNFVGWLTLKANIAPQKKRLTKSKVSIFLPIKIDTFFGIKHAKRPKLANLRLKKLESEMDNTEKFGF